MACSTREACDHQAWTGAGAQPICSNRLSAISRRRLRRWHHPGTDTASSCGSWQDRAGSSASPAWWPSPARSRNRTRSSCPGGSRSNVARSRVWRALNSRSPRPEWPRRHKNRIAWWVSQGSRMPSSPRLRNGIWIKADKAAKPVAFTNGCARGSFRAAWASLPVASARRIQFAVGRVANVAGPARFAGLPSKRRGGFDPRRLDDCQSGDRHPEPDHRDHDFHATMLSDCVGRPNHPIKGTNLYWRAARTRQASAQPVDCIQLRTRADVLTGTHFGDNGS